MNFDVFADKLLWFLLAGVLAAFGWFCRMIFDRLDRQRDELIKQAKQLYELRAALPSNYVKKAEFEKMGDSLFEKLRAIENVLLGSAPAPTKRRRSRIEEVEPEHLPADTTT